MELDEMKRAWQSLDRRIDSLHAFTLQQATKDRVGRAQRRLRRLVLGQHLQFVLGLLLVVGTAAYGATHRHIPHLLLSALALHAYGWMMALFAARTLYVMRRIDYAAPVLAIQAQLAQLKVWITRCGLWFTVTGCFSWVPLLLVIFSLLGVDIWDRQPLAVAAWLISSIVCLALSYGLWRQSRRTGSERLKKFVDDSVVGRSIREAQAELDEIARFSELH